MLSCKVLNANPLLIRRETISANLCAWIYPIAVVTQILSTRPDSVEQATAIRLVKTELIDAYCLDLVRCGNALVSSGKRQLY
jgi:hypothetical protein